MPSRRHMIVTTAGALIAMQGRGLLQDPQGTEVTEEYRGDPDLPIERVTFDPEAIRALSERARSGRATFEPYAAGVPAAMLGTARSMIGSSRTKTPDLIT